MHKGTQLERNWNATGTQLERGKETDMHYGWDYEDVIDWVSCEECRENGHKVEAKKFVNDRDLCESCYEQCPKCWSCGTLEFDTSKTMCAECIAEDERERIEQDKIASEEPLFFDNPYLQNVADLWENIRRYI